MDWVTLLSVVTVGIGTVAGSEWMSRDRERSKLERDVAIYQQHLPARARQTLEAAIDARTFVIADRENEEQSRLVVYVHAVALTWSLALVVYATWRIAEAFTVLNVVVLAMALALPAVILGLYSYQADRRKASYKRRLADRGEPTEQVGRDSAEPPDLMRSDP